MVLGAAKAVRIPKGHSDQVHYKAIIRRDSLQRIMSICFMQVSFCT